MKKLQQKTQQQIKWLFCEGDFDGREENKQC